MKIKFTLSDGREIEFDEAWLNKLVNDSIRSISVTVEHDDAELTVCAEEGYADCASIYVDGAYGQKNFQFATVQTPGEYSDDSFIAKLYAGATQYETDASICAVKSKCDGRSTDGSHYSEKDTLTKIVYFDPNYAITKPWNGDAWSNRLNKLPEHVEDKTL